MNAKTFAFLLALASAGAPSATPGTEASGRYSGKRFEISYPKDWRAIGADARGCVTIVPPDGFDQGVLKRGACFAFWETTAELPEPEARRRILADRLHDNPNASVEGEPEPISLPAGKAQVIRLRNERPDTPRESIRIITLSRPNGVFYFVFWMPEAQERANLAEFQNIAASVRFID